MSMDVNDIDELMLRYGICSHIMRNMAAMK